VARLREVHALWRGVHLAGQGFLTLWQKLRERLGGEKYELLVGVAEDCSWRSPGHAMAAGM
jgi:hypothetical protein